MTLRLKFATTTRDFRLVLKEGVHRVLCDLRDDVIYAPPWATLSHLAQAVDQFAKSGLPATARGIEVFPDPIGGSEDDDKRTDSNGR